MRLRALDLYGITMTYERQELMLLAADRQEGKSTQAFAWLSNGQKTGGYPGWTRVLVVVNRAMVHHHKYEYWHRMEDYDHRVYHYEEWRDARSVHPETQVCIDDLDHLLGARIGHLPGRVVAATITAWPWREQHFQEWEPPTWTP